MEIKHEITFSGEIEGKAATANVNEVFDLIAEFHRSGHVANGIVHIKPDETRLHTPTISTSVCDTETLVDLYLKNPNAPKPVPEGMDDFHFILHDEGLPELVYITSGFKLTIPGGVTDIFWKAFHDMNEFCFRTYNGNEMTLVASSLMRLCVTVGEITDWDMRRIWRNHIQPHFEKMEERLNELQEVINSLEF